MDKIGCQPGTEWKYLRQARKLLRLYYSKARNIEKFKVKMLKSGKKVAAAVIFKYSTWKYLRQEI